MTSIKDVAKLADVSVMTASRVVNNRVSVSGELRARVLEAAKALDYRPNLAARGLRMSRSQLFGLLLPDIENPVFSALAKHVEEAANRHGYSVILGNTWEDCAREAKYIELMRSRRMDGLVLSPVSAKNNELIGRCPTPVVLLDRSFHKTAPPPAVSMDNVEAGRMAARHLLTLGHRHFAVIPGPLHIDVFADRLQGYGEEIARAGRRLAATASPGDIGKTDYGARALEELLRLCPRLRPLAVFCANDLTALGAMQAAFRLGLAVPGDISIFGVDDIPAAAWCRPTLTTIRPPSQEIADVGVALLVDILNNRAVSPENVKLPPRLVVRESTGPYRAPPRGSGKK